MVCGRSAGVGTAGSEENKETPFGKQDAYNSQSLDGNMSKLGFVLQEVGQLDSDKGNRRGVMISSVGSLL